MIARTRSAAWVMSPSSWLLRLGSVLRSAAASGSVVNGAASMACRNAVSTERAEEARRSPPTAVSARMSADIAASQVGRTFVGVPPVDHDGTAVAEHDIVGMKVEMQDSPRRIGWQ